MAACTTAGECLDFWFAPKAEATWFRRSDAFDAAVREALGPLHRQACDGGLEAWKAEPDACLALILLLDQVPRNLYRGSPEAFRFDGEARQLAWHGLRLGHDLRIAPDRLTFFYLPFQHSEVLSDQYLSMALFATLPKEDALQWAEAHLRVIERFGRFPHRNAALGRRSTPAEEAYLAEPDAGF